MIIELPFPPSVNTYWRHVVLGKRVTTLISKKGREYAKQVSSIIIANNFNLRISAPVAVTLRLYAPDRRRRDVDNYAKALLDALVKSGLLEDDSLIKDLRITWCGYCQKGKVVVEIIYI